MDLRRRRFVVDAGDAGRLGDQLADGPELRPVVHVNVRHLVVGHREGGAGPRVQQFPSQLDADRQQPGVAEHAIQVDGAPTRVIPYSLSSTTVVPRA